MTGVIEGPFIGLALGQLFNVVWHGASLLVKNNKNYLALYDMLTDLKPVVDDVDNRTTTEPWTPWLRRLQEQLEKADALIQKVKTQSKYNIVKKTKRSAELMEVTEAIRELRGAAVMPVFASTLQNSDKLDKLDKLDELIQQMQQNHQDLQFAMATRNAVNTKAVRAFELDTNRTTSTRVVQEIREQADALATRRDSHRGSDNGATSSNAEQQGKSKGLGKIGEVIVGGDEFVEKVKNLLLSDEKSKWVGVWSMGGAGKTLTAERVSKSPDIRRHFDGGIFWLTVGREQTSFSLLNLLYNQITKTTGEWETEKDLKVQVESQLGDRRVLLILDDVWTPAKLHSLHVLHHSGSKIFVTTRDKSLLDAVLGENLKLPLLSPERSWELFCWHAFGGKDFVARVLEKDARAVANECKQLPLALKVIGATMRGKKDPKLWKINLKRLKHALIISVEHEKQLFQRLQISIDDLGQLDGRLIDCFNYFAAFPEDHAVHLDDLLGLWMREGMVRGNSALSPEDDAYLLLGHLINRSLIEIDRSLIEMDRFVYKVHDVLRDLARHNLHDLEPDERLCLYKPGLQLTSFPEDWIEEYSASHLQTSTTSNSLTFPLVKRMSLMHNDLEELPSEKLIAPHLLVFLVGHNSRLESLPQSFFVGLSHLRVLDLSRTGIRMLPAGALLNLECLVLLDLSHCKKLEEIPDSIKDLRNLEELRLNNCMALEAIPRGVCFLKKLQVLLVDGSEVWDLEQLKGFWLLLRPSWISFLLWLRPRWISMGAATLRDVCCLTSLTNLTVSSHTLTGFRIESKSLRKLRHLTVTFPGLRSFPDLSELKDLESLRLHSENLTELPEGITTLSNLTKLEVNRCIALSSLPALDKLSRLEHLDLSSCNQLRIVPESFGHDGSFPSLVEFRIDSCRNLVFPNLDPGAMPKLSRLSLTRSHQLQQLPVCLRVLENLRGLDLSYCTNLVTLEPAFDLISFPCLEHLRVAHTRLTQLPKYLATKPNLIKLDVTGCPAGNPLPPEFQNVERLEIVTEFTESSQ